MSVKRVTGHGAFAGDLRLPGLLHVRAVRSPHAHARIVRVDSRAARALPGVVAVLTHEDLAPAAAPRDRPTLGPVVRFVGDRVAAVVAEDHDLAQRAAAAVQVEYETLPAVLDPEQALRPEAPLVHGDAPAVPAGTPPNLAARVEVSLGDVERVLGEAERVLDAAFRLPAFPVSPLEPRVTLTWLDEDQRLVVRASTEAPFRVRETLAARLSIPAARIRVVQPQVGGGFGGKSEVLVEDLCALVTLRTGRPARFAFTREEELTVAPSRPAETVRLRGALAEGRLAALDLRLLADVGAYPAGAEAALRSAARETLSLYGIPHVRFVGEAACTHRPPTTLLRGQGPLAALLALESLMDEAAAALGEDPVELRRRHLAAPEDAARVAAALGEPPPQGGHPALGDALTAGAAAMEWSRRWKGAARSGPRRRAMGVALARHAATGERGAASLQVREDGSFNLTLGASATGIETTLAGAAADLLALPPERVVPAVGDTDSAPVDPGSAAPTVFLTGRAVERAASLVRARLLAAGARRLGGDPRDAQAADGEVRLSGGGAVSYAELARDSFAAGAPISATTFVSSDEAPAAGAATFAEVEVDLETGEARVLRVVVALDGGPLSDPRLAEALGEGDALRAVSQVLVRERGAGVDGRPLFRTLRDQPLGTAVDAPAVETLFVPRESPASRFGTKPTGEVSAAGPVLAVVSALAHALGEPVRELPLRPDRVRAAGPKGRG